MISLLPRPPGSRRGLLTGRRGSGTPADALPSEQAAQALAAYWEQVEAETTARRELAAFLVGYLSGKNTDMTGPTPRGTDHPLRSQVRHRPGPRGRGRGRHSGRCAPGTRRVYVRYCRGTSSLRRLRRTRPADTVPGRSPALPARRLPCARRRAGGAPWPGLRRRTRRRAVRCRRAAGRRSRCR
jgi:hypothetical protein